MRVDEIKVNTNLLVVMSKDAVGVISFVRKEPFAAIDLPWPSAITLDNIREIEKELDGHR